MQKSGKLVVYEPTDKFVKWVYHKRGLMLLKITNSFGMIGQLIIENYKPGSYKGILGVAATFNGEIM